MYVYVREKRASLIERILDTIEDMAAEGMYACMHVCMYMNMYVCV